MAALARQSDPSRGKLKNIHSGCLEIHWYNFALVAMRQMQIFIGMSLGLDWPIKHLALLLAGICALPLPALAQSSSEYSDLALREINASNNANKSGDRASACRHLNAAAAYVESFYIQSRIEFEPFMRASEARLAAARAYDRARSVHGGGYIPVEAYIRAQIAAASAGLQGSPSLPDATRDYYNAKEHLLRLEHTVQRTQLALRQSKARNGCP